MSEKNLYQLRVGDFTFLRNEKKKKKKEHV